MKRFLVLAFALVALFGLPRGAAAAADFTVGSSGQGAYLINGQPNPTLTLTRGKTYTFDIVTSDHPFWIKTVPEIGNGSIFSAGVTNNGASPGVVTFTVPASAPPELYYQCQYHEPMNGTLTIVNAPAPAAATVPAMTNLTRGLLGGGLALLGLAPLSWLLHRRASQPPQVPR
jgi:hypothetical protein